jgi:hypothetical protein
MMAGLGSFIVFPAFPQAVISAQSGLVHYVQGRVYLNDALVKTSFGQFPQVKQNQVLRTAEGRAEVLLSPGVFLRVGENSSIRMLATRLSDTRLALLSGTIIVEAAELLKDNSVTVSFNSANVHLGKRGVYRLDADAAELRVFDGEAEVIQADQRIEVKKGKMLALDGNSLTVQKFDRSQTDALDRWSGRRAEYLAMANLYSARAIYDSGVPWPRSGWSWNPYFGMFAFIPMSGYYHSFYGYDYYSPMQAYMVFAPARSSGFGESSASHGYRTIAPTPGGASGTIAVSRAGNGGNIRAPAPAPAGPASAPAPAPASLPRSSGSAGGRTR